MTFKIQVAVPIHFRCWWSPIVMERAQNMKFSLYINSWLRHFSHTFYEGFNTNKTRTQEAKWVAFAAVTFEKTFL